MEGGGTVKNGDWQRTDCERAHEELREKRTRPGEYRAEMMLSSALRFFHSVIKMYVSLSNLPVDLFFFFPQFI